MKIPITLDDEQKNCILDIKTETEICVINCTTESLALLKRYCLQFLKFPIVQTMNEDID
jgi:hypothetical protein